MLFRSSNRDYTDPGFRNKMSIAAKNRSCETRSKISENNKRLHREGLIGTKGKTPIRNIKMTINKEKE